MDRANTYLNLSDFLIWDVDPSGASGPALGHALVQAGYDGDYTADLGAYLGSLPNYGAIFICLGLEWLGSYPAEVDSLVSYLTDYDSTNIYVEGPPTWTGFPTALHPYFNIPGVSSNS